MSLKFKNRQENTRKKILIYGLDGTGKSTYAEKYCKENNLNAVVIDIDDTNFSSLPIIDLKFGNDLATYNSIKKAIDEINKSEFDTIILDGVTSLLEMLVSKAKGMSKYSDRAMRWNDILFKMESTNKNLIFIGQIDMEMLFTEDYQPSKAVIKVNSLVNEKYKCYITDKGDYDVEVKKMRTIEMIEAEAKAPKKLKPKEDFETAANINSNKTAARSVAEEIIKGLGDTPTLLMAKLELAKLSKEADMGAEECESILQCLEVLLNGTDR